MEAAGIVWILISAALVVFMTVGLALFYGGLDSAKNVSNMLMMNFYCMGIVPIVWAIVGYSIAFGGWTFPLIGNFDFVLLRNVDTTRGLAEFAFLAAFAIISPAIISGAVADRMKFVTWALFVPIWLLLVYAPVTYWVFGPNGWLLNLGALDFAGGTSIHINAGISALALVLVLGPRRGWPASASPPHSLSLVLAGAGILWLGWFGFNAGSALAPNATAALAFVNTLLGAAAGVCAWLLIQAVRKEKPGVIGACSGAVCGLVAITPACAFVHPFVAILIGATASLAAFYALKLKTRFKYDDSLDVVGIHLVSGVVGGLYLGFFASVSAVPGGGDFLNGLFFGGGGELLWKQIVGMVAPIVYGFVVTWIIAKALDKTIGLRVSKDEEEVGLDRTQHDESAYSNGEDTILGCK